MGTPATRPASVISMLGALCLLAACGGSDDAVERAVERSQDAFETARRQGVDLARTPCIYYPNDDEESWFAFVVLPGDGPPRKAAMQCPGGESLGWVALNQSGDVIEVQGIPSDWREVEP